MNKRDSRVFANGIVVSNDTWKTKLNNNDLIIGGSGKGKTRSYVKPNIERATNESIVVADTKGNLYETYREMLESRGYRVLNFDFKNIEETKVGFDPVRYIRRNKYGCYLDQDIIKLGSLLCPCAKDTKDPFWDLSAQNFINCAIACMLEIEMEAEQNMETLFEYTDVISKKEFEKIIYDIREKSGDGCYAVKCFGQISDTRESEKTMASILSIMRNHIAVFNSKDVLKMFTHPNQFRFESLGEEKTALFLTISDSDRSMDRLVNLMYTQMFDALIQHADKQKGERLKVPVHFYMDDFATNTMIPDFDNLISVIRSREISVSIIIQNIEQLGKSYPNGATTIITNCDHILFLGTQDSLTASYIGNRIGKMATTIMNMPLSKAMLIESGSPCRMIDKYEPEPREIVSVAQKRSRKAVTACCG